METFINAIGFIISTVLFGLTLTKRGILSMHGGEYMTLHDTGLSFIAVCLSLFAGILLLRKLLSRLQVKPKALTVFRLCAFIKLLLGIYLIFNVNAVMYYDDRKIFEPMKRAVTGDLTFFGESNYFFYSPHQLLLLAFEMIPGHLSTRIEFFYLLNLLELVWTDYFLFWLSGHFFGETTQRRVCFWSLLFTAPLFYTLWVYGDIPGLFFLAAGLTALVRFDDEKRLRDGITGVICLALSYSVRHTNLIALIALGIIYAIRAVRTRSFRVMLPILLTALLSFGLEKGVIRAFEQRSGEDFSGGIPTMGYIAMGMQSSPEKPANPGWYNGYNWTVYDEYRDDSSAAAKEAIRERLEAFRNDPGMALSFYFEKAATTWCEPSFQGLWYSPLHIFGGPMKSQLLASLRGEDEGVLYKAYLIAANLVNALIFAFTGLTLLRMLRSKEQLSEFTLFPVLFLCGIFVFHLFFWETKSRYVFESVYFLLPLATYPPSTVSRSPSPAREDVSVHLQ